MLYNNFGAKYSFCTKVRWGKCCYVDCGRTMCQAALPDTFNYSGRKFMTLAGGRWFLSSLAMKSMYGATCSKKRR